jgi:hypothetical protein
MCLKRHQALYPVKGGPRSASLFLQRGDTTKNLKLMFPKNTCPDLVGYRRSKTRTARQQVEIHLVTTI